MERETNIVGRMIVGGVIGALFGNLIGTHIELNQAEKNVHIAQEHNAQLLGQLSTNFDVEHLIVDVAGSSFEFTTESAARGEEACIGEYELRNDTAYSVGQITCTAVRTIED